MASKATKQERAEALPPDGRDARLCARALARAVRRMMRVGSEATARAFALERRACFGWSVFGGAWYVGTAEQLRAIGVLEPQRAAP